jgi:hypothetical protein
MFTARSASFTIQTSRGCCWMRRRLSAICSALGTALPFESARTPSATAIPKASAISSVVVAVSSTVSWSNAHATARSGLATSSSAIVASTSIATAPTWVMYGSSEPGTFWPLWRAAAKCQARM